MSLAKWIPPVPANGNRRYSSFAPLSGVRLPPVEQTMRARSARWRARTRPRRWLCFLAVLLLACLASCGVQAGATVLAETQGHEAFDDAAAAAIVAHAALGNTAACAAVASAGARCIAQRRRRDELDKGRFSLQRASGGFGLLRAATRRRGSSGRCCARIGHAPLLSPKAMPRAIRTFWRLRRVYRLRLGLGRAHARRCGNGCR